MKIAVVTASFLPRVGGAEFAVHHLAQQWVACGHDVVVINHVANEPTHPQARYRVRRYRRPPGERHYKLHGRFATAWVTRQLRTLLATEAPDAISAHMAYPVGVWLGSMRGLPPFVVTPHGPALNETPGGPRQRYGLDDLVARSLNAASGVVAVSSHARAVMERIGVRPDAIADIPNGVEVDRFGATTDVLDLRGELELPADAVVVLSVGRDTVEKDYETGLAAFAAAAADVPGLYYVLVGRGIEAAWRPRAESLGIADRVRFSDGLFDDRLVAAYQQADLFFLPSMKELCPLVVPEAMAAGLPAVVTNVSGSQDMVHDGENGFVAEPRDAAGLAAGLRKLARDEALRSRLGRTARERAARYDWRRIADQYLQLMT